MGVELRVARRKASKASIFPFGTRNSLLTPSSQLIRCVVRRYLHMLKSFAPEAFGKSLLHLKFTMHQKYFFYMFTNLAAKVTAQVISIAVGAE